ncbi:MAG: hypothetical protein JW839_02140 [Candidatus Lokiarchaeota archaeon]|nr:hypothetical protein [Candidatus Lokiarchaeota archaeon]
MSNVYSPFQTTKPAIAAEASFCNADWATDILAATTIYDIFGDIIGQWEWPETAWDKNEMLRSLNTTTLQFNVGRKDNPPVMKASNRFYPKNFVHAAYFFGAGLHEAAGDYFKHTYPHSTAGSRTLQGQMHSFSLHRQNLLTDQNILVDYLGCVMPELHYTWEELDPALQCRAAIWGGYPVTGAALTDPTTQIVAPTGSVEKRYTHAGSDTGIAVDIAGAVTLIAKRADIVFKKKVEPIYSKRSEALTKYPVKVFTGPESCEVDLLVVGQVNTIETLLRTRNFADDDAVVTIKAWKEGEDTDEQDKVAFTFSYADLRRGSMSPSFEQGTIQSQLHFIPKTWSVVIHDSINGSGAGKYPV